MSWPSSLPSSYCSACWLSIWRCILILWFRGVHLSNNSILVLGKHPDVHSPSPQACQRSAALSHRELLTLGSKLLRVFSSQSLQVRGEHATMPECDTLSVFSAFCHSLSSHKVPHINFILDQSRSQWDLHCSMLTHVRLVHSKFNGFKCKAAWTTEYRKSVQQQKTIRELVPLHSPFNNTTYH